MNKHFTKVIQFWIAENILCENFLKKTDFFYEFCLKPHEWKKFKQNFLQKFDYCLTCVIFEDSTQTLEFFYNACVVCGINLGNSNPRQLCCKTYCSSN